MNHVDEVFSFTSKVKFYGASFPGRKEGICSKSVQCRSKGNISGGATRSPEARAARGVWGYAPPENFEIQRLGNAISSVLQELFVIYAYRKLFTSYTVSKNKCTLRV